MRRVRARGSRRRRRRTDLCADEVRDERVAGALELDLAVADLDVVHGLAACGGRACECCVGARVGVCRARAAEAALAKVGPTEAWRGVVGVGRVVLGLCRGRGRV